MISVIVPVYNTKKEYLEQCIDSILNQSYKDIQLLLVDDGSDLNCAAVLDDYTKKDFRCEVIHVQHGGVSKARNVGIDFALSKHWGDYITFVDSDDWLTTDCLEKLLHNIDLVSLSIIKFTNYFQDIQRFDDKKESHEFSMCANRRHIFDTLYGCTMDASRWMLNSVWGKLYRLDIIYNGKIRFDTALNRLEDGVFNLSYLTYLNGQQKIQYIDSTGYYLRQHGQSTVHKYNPNLAKDMILPLEKMYEISVQSNMYEEDKAALGYRSLLNSIIYINDCACGNDTQLLQSIEITKTFIETDIIQKLIAWCSLENLQHTEKMVAKSIQQGKAIKPVLYFWLRKKIKYWKEKKIII